MKPVYHIRVIRSILALFFCSAFAWGCQYDEAARNVPLFQLLPPQATGISFENRLSFTPEFNIYKYRNFYNGGGVAIGDVNGDSLPDVFLTGNQVSNRLYFNQGNFHFKDVTERAGVAGNRAWSTGASMADVNGDGWFDIYVCNSGIVEGDDRKNELYINNRDGTFSERAEEYGVADPGLSIHGTFFDYDKDGDLDLYLVNNSFRAIGSFDLENNLRNVRDAEGGDRLYRNELISASAENGSARFTDVSQKAGIYGSEIGFGLGASVGDLNRDGWPDLYISNDFFERDYLYLNQGDGTFNEVLEQQIRSISAASMGADIADINHDGYPEIFVTDMLPKREERLKTITTFDSWENYQNYVKNDYYHQFTRNTLQLNNGNGTFSEVGRLAGVEASDWSWGALIADFDLDGHRDIFVANGIYKDVINQDYLKHIGQESVIRSIVTGNNVNYKKLIEIIPSNPISNYAFRNKGNLRFDDATSEWGLDTPGFSNGSAYGDLDLDGDLDLVVNNVNMHAFVYRNRAVERKAGNWLEIQLQGEDTNKYGVGARISLWADGRYWYAEQQPVRGFQSSVDPMVHIGLGEVTLIDSLKVVWTDGRISRFSNIPASNQIVVRQAEALKPKGTTYEEINLSPLLQKVDHEAIGLKWNHRENNYNDFFRQPMLLHMRSNEGPPACIADINGDKLDDVYLGGAKNQAGALFIQYSDGRFQKKISKSLDADAISEDSDCLWFDVNGDSNPDLYVASGSSEFPVSSSALNDRLYLGNGKGDLEKASQALPPSTRGYSPTGTVAATDYDGDGDIDLFVGERLRPFAYGAPVGGHLLENNGNGQFREVTSQMAPDMKADKLKTAGITAAGWADLNGDGTQDLVIAGEWMPLTIFYNQMGKFRKVQLENTKGLWQSLEIADLDADGDLDLVGGNLGLNSRLQASTEQPLSMWSGDFDRNGEVEQIMAEYHNGKMYPLVLRHDLLKQLPYLKPYYTTYDAFAGQTVKDIFDEQRLRETVTYKVNQLASVVVWNNGDKGFGVRPLPLSAQFAPIYDILATHLNNDGIPELLLGGNLHRTKPGTGRYDASYGITLTLKSNLDYSVIQADESGFHINGEVRAIQELQNRTEDLILVTRNGDSIHLFKKNNTDLMAGY